MSRKKAKQQYCGVGGQAVLDGIMMRNGNDYAIAVRKTDGTIAVEKKVGKKKEKSILSRIPFVRGVVNFIDSLRVGFQSLNFSAEVGMEDVLEEPGRFERFLKKHFGDKANDIIMSFTVFAAVLLAVAVFIMLPYGISAYAGQYIQSSMVLSVFEGVLRLMIFIGYVTLIGLMEDIDRMYMYHGAEHKCINCIERGKPLTVRNVRRSSRLHPRCGTSFMLYVMVISCVCFFFIQTSNPLLRLLYRLLLIPVIAAVSYELIRLAGRSSNPIVKLLNLPGMGMQMLSTREPDDEMIEVAIQAVEAVFDWEGYQAVVFGTAEEENTLEEETDGEPEAEFDKESEADYEPEEEFEKESEADYVSAGEFGEEPETEYEPGEEPEKITEEMPEEDIGEESEEEIILRENAEMIAYLDRLIEEEMKQDSEGDGDLPDAAVESDDGAETEKTVESDDVIDTDKSVNSDDGIAADTATQANDGADADYTAVADNGAEADDETEADNADPPDAAARPENADMADIVSSPDSAYRVRSEEEAGQEIEELLEHDL